MRCGGEHQEPDRRDRGKRGPIACTPYRVRQPTTQLQRDHPTLSLSSWQ
jgi:hypothetical protein